MKKALKIILGVVIFLYLVVVIFTTAFLLKKNDYGVSKFLNRYLILVEEDTLEPDYKENTLLAIKEVDAEDIEVGDKVFYYDTHSPERTIKFSKVTQKNVDEQYIEFTMSNNNTAHDEYILGTEASTKAMTTLGQMLYIVQSKWGFLFIVVFPLFLAFIYEIYAIYKEFKKK